MNPVRTAGPPTRPGVSSPHAIPDLDGRRVTERKGDVRPADPPPDLVVHKSTRECPMIQPHPRALCGIVRLREATAARMDEERRRAGSQANGQPGGG